MTTTDAIALDSLAITNTGPSQPLTEYIVLIKQDGEGWKTIFPNVEARSSEHAVKAASNGTAGTYVAIPSRSWKPVKVSVETVKRVRLEDA